MKSITQDMLFRQSLLKYSEKFGVTKAAIKYKTNISIVGEDGTTERWNCLGISQGDRITILTNTPKMS